MNLVEIHNLSKYYDRSHGIDGLSLDVQQGDIFGFIGPNGAGKLTTATFLQMPACTTA